MQFYDTAMKMKFISLYISGFVETRYICLGTSISNTYYYCLYVYSSQNKIIRSKNHLADIYISWVSMGSANCLPSNDDPSVHLPAFLTNVYRM